MLSWKKIILSWLVSWILSRIVLSSKEKLFSEMWGFPTLYFDMLVNEIEGKHMTQTCQAVNSLRE